MAVEIESSESRIADREGAELVREFAERVAEWKKATLHHSSTNRVRTHPTTHRLLELGPAIVPLIVDELGRSTGHWFLLLIELTGENPIPPEASGNATMMAQAWKRWWSAQSNGTPDEKRSPA